jgi:MFS family permease
MYYSFPLFAIPMAAELGVSKPDIYIAITIGLLLSSFTAYFVGTAIDKGYGRVILTAGSIAGGVLLMAWSQVESLLALYALFVGLGVVLAMTLYEPGFAVVARRFGSESRRGITNLTLWGGFASTVFVPLIQWLIDTVEWRQALIILGLINLVINAAVHYITIDPRKDAPQEAPSSTPDEPDMQAAANPVRWALKQPVFWGILLSFTLYYGMFSGLTFHLYPLLLERGFESGSVVFAIACIGPAQVAGRILVWWIAREHPIRVVGMGVVLVLPVSIALLRVVPVDIALLAAVAILWGAVNGISTIVRANAVPEMLTRHAYGAINGLLTAPVMTVVALAPVSAAALWSVTGSYDALLNVAIVVSLLVAVLFWFAALASMRRPPEPPSDRPAT